LITFATGFGRFRTHPGNFSCIKKDFRAKRKVGAKNRVITTQEWCDLFIDLSLIRQTLIHIKPGGGYFTFIEKLTYLFPKAGPIDTVIAIDDQDAQTLRSGRKQLFTKLVISADNGDIMAFEYRVIIVKASWVFCLLLGKGRCKWIALYCLADVIRTDFILFSLFLFQSFIPGHSFGIIQAGMECHTQRGRFIAQTCGA
jgi:hypothetical protein